MMDDWEQCGEGETLVERCGVKWKHTTQATLMGGPAYRRGYPYYRAEREGGYTYECSAQWTFKGEHYPLPTRVYAAIIYKHGFPYKRYTCDTLEEAMQKCLAVESVVRLEA